MTKKLRFLFTLLFVMAATLSWGEEYKLTVTPTDFTTKSYADNNKDKTKNAVSTSNSGKKYEVTWYSYQVYQNSGAMQWQSGKGYIYNKTDLGTIKAVNIEVSTNGGSYTTYYGTSVNPSESTIVGDGFFKIKVGNSTGKTTKLEVIFEIADTPSKTDIANLAGLSPTSLNVGDSGDFSLGATFAEGTVAGTDYTVSWESSNTDVLDVVGGTYEAKAAGTANVTVTVTPNDTENYNEVSKSFKVTVIPAPFENIAKLTEQTANGTYMIQLNNAVVTYVNGNYAYIQDESGAVVLYKNGHGFTAGQILSGTAEVTFQIRNANPQITNITGYTATEGTAPEPTVIAASEWNKEIASVLSQWFKVTGTTITLENNKYYVQLGNEKVQIYGQGEANPISVNDLTAKYTIIGFPTMYNTTPELQIFVQPEVETYTITVASNNEDWGTVLLEGTIITANPKAGYRVAMENPFVVTSGTASISQDGNEFTVNAQTDCTVTINFEAIPTHKATFSVNGVVTEKGVAEGDAITFDIPGDVFGKSFVGWTTAAIDGTTDEEPELVALGTMGSVDVVYYAVFAIVTPGTSSEKTDKLTRETTGVTGTSYTDWSDKTVTSGAVYAGNSAGGNESIQLRSNNSNSGIISTTSGGKLTKVVVEWNSNTANDRTLDVYGKNSAYSAATDLYNSSSQGTKLGSIVYGTSTELTISGDYEYIGLRSNSGAMYLDEISITWENGTPASYSDYCTTVVKPVSAVSAPVIFHDEGTYEGALTVAIAGGGTIKYTLNGGAVQTYSAPFTISETTTVKAWTEQDGNKSDEVSKTFTIVSKPTLTKVDEGYYSIKNGTGKYINVAGRKTVTFTDAIDDKAGTVIKVKANENRQVEVLRSQGIDLPGYADKAMHYVPEIVKLVVEKLHAEGSGEILGENGLDAIMKKFNESFDYHLYIENVNDNDNANGNDNAGYRIYGKTPSMKPVVDFYAENKANVDYKLPQLEAFINSAIQKVLQKTGGRGASILTDFSLHEIWEKMGGTLTEPTDEATTAKFYEEVLSSEANVWNFAYQTAMKYWEPLINHDKVKENLDKLGDMAKYLEKVENIRPDFKYYIVANTAGNDVDFISEGNTDINAARATWTLEKRTDFKVTFNKENSINLGRELYTTLYTDFAYTVPEKVKAYKVTAIDEKTGLATKEEITGVIPAQTPVLLMSIDVDNLTQALTLSTEAGTAVTGNLLQGPDWLINKYQIKAKQVEDLFGYVHDALKMADVESLYDSYIKKYEYLMIRNAGTVNNKYFFGLSGDDIAEVVVNVCQLAKQGNTRKRLAFYHNLEKVDANKAFIPSEKVEPVYLSLIGDVNRDGYVNITDVTCQIDIVLGKDKPEDNYDYDAADLDGNDEIRIDDVTDLIDVVLGKKTIE